MSQYKCKNCNHTFHRYDSRSPVCPSCGSDDVKKILPWKSIVGMATLGIASVATGYYVTDLFLSNSSTPDNHEMVVQTESGITSGNESGASKSDSIPTDVDGSQAEAVINDTIAVTSPSTNGNMVLITSTPRVAGNGSYSFSASVSNVPSDAIVSYELLNSVGNRIITMSKDGKFTGITPDASGRFIVRARAIVNGAVLSEVTRVVSGFGQGAAADVVGTKLTIGEVNGLFKSGALRNAKRHPKIVPNVSVVCSGLQSGDAASSIADVYYIQKMRNATASVVGLQYDASGKVRLIQFHITYNAASSTDVSADE